MSSADTAKRCFEENLRLFASAQTQPEKFNLYNGLASMSKAIQELQEEVNRLRREVETVRGKL